MFWRSVPAMSSPREKAEGPRQPKCTRCRHHGLVVPQKGHAKKCPYSRCSCWKCRLITERTRINAMQRQLERGPGEAEATEASETPESSEPCRPVTRSLSADSPGDPDPPREPDPPPNPVYWGDFFRGSLPLLHLPVHMPGPFPHSSNILVNMPWSPGPPGLVPLMVPPFPPIPLYCPAPEQEAPLELRAVIVPPAPSSPQPNVED